MHPTDDLQESHLPNRGTSRILAAIDVGTASVRMAIAEIDPLGQIRVLDAVDQPVDIGKDTFTRGTIRKSTTEECVRVLKSFKHLLREYCGDQPPHIRAVATSAVREASNREKFLDRLYIATGMRVEPIDESDVNRLTFLAVEPLLQTDKHIDPENVTITEVGGGSTELLVLQQGRIASSQTFRLGALRLRERLEAFRAPVIRERAIMESQILRTVSQITAMISKESTPQLITLGGDMRFAAGELVKDREPGQLAQVSVPKLAKLTRETLALSVDELVSRYHLTFQDAETLGPALLAYLKVAQSLGLKHVYVSRITMRDCLLQDMISRKGWSEHYRQLILQSAMDLARRYHIHEGHANQVMHLCGKLFDELQEEHGLEARHLILLQVAAILHEIGNFINTRGHHKHSMYIIQSSDIFGLNKKDEDLVAQVARYHRRAAPSRSHPDYAILSEEDRITVMKLAAILRLADALDRAHNKRITQVACTREGDRMVIAVDREDTSIEAFALQEKGTMFEEVYGLKVVLRKGKRSHG